MAFLSITNILIKMFWKSLIFSYDFRRVIVQFFLTSRYVSSVFQNKGSYIGLGEGAFEYMCMCGISFIWNQH